MAKEGLIAVGAGAVSAIAALSLLSGSAVALPFFYLAPMPLYLVGLGYGVKAAAFAALGGTMVAGLFGSAASVGALVAALPYAAAWGLPAWLVCRLALAGPADGTGAAPGENRIPAGQVLVAIATMGFAAVAVSAVYAAIHGVSLEHEIRGFLGAGFRRIGLTLSSEAQKQAVAGMAALFPGMAAASWLLMTVISATLAQTILARTGRSLRQSPKYADLRLPEWVSWPLVGSAVLVLVSSGDLEYTARNLTYVAAVPFFFLGLAAIHTIVRRVPAAAAILTGVYFVVAISGWAQMIVAGLGIMELWVGVRQRFAGSPEERENE